MLVLTRKAGEELVINDNIRVKVVAVRGRRVRLGIAAPEEVSVQRLELVRTPGAAEGGSTSAGPDSETTTRYVQAATAASGDGQGRIEGLGTEY